MSTREITTVAFEMPNDILAKVDEYCKKNERTRSFVFRKGTEDFLANAVRLQEIVEKQKSITILGNELDIKKYPKIFEIAQADPVHIEESIINVMKTKGVDNLRSAMTILESNL